ncbi:hypothetical protein BLA60_16980 [Actinophytocola xinjiangensis]|uniref:AMP-dependent synthetase/ligase domain-containing protein n=1 Tax=Actinophytocola xinjiangensis TaxID=485602 RepID=A0A7Z0WN59_9PSEU|nr:hypothetical protein BLA60_16980 [Actinophytocola xinjiangensis]
MYSTFAEVVAHHHDRVAVVDDDGSHDYACPARRVGETARALRANGCAPGILRAGGAYLSIEPSLPAARVATMLDLASVPIVITDAGTDVALPGRVTRLRLDGLLAGRDDAPDVEVDPAGPAVVNFTSGSKGVLVAHRGITSLLHSADFLGLSADTVLLNPMSPSFDGMTVELWGPPLHGGTCVLFTNDVLAKASVENLRLPVGGAASVDSITATIREFDVNVTCGMSTTLVRVADLLLERGEVAGSVELLLFAGEPLFDDVRTLLAKAFPNAAVGSLGYAAVDGAPVPGGDMRVHESLAPYSLIELHDEATGAPITEAGVPGRLVATTMSRTLMPVIRCPTVEWVRSSALATNSRTGNSSRWSTNAPPPDRTRPMATARSRRHRPL